MLAMRQMDTDGWQVGLTDIDGNERNTLTPDVGAYEFDGIKDTTDLSPLHGIYTIDNIRPKRTMVDSDTATIWVLVTTINNCTASDTIQIVFIDEVGITGYHINDYFKLYPNPSTGKFYLEFKETGKKDIHIYDLLGRTIFNGKFEGEKIELELNHTGIYVIDINGNVRSKVVIVK